MQNPSFVVALILGSIMLTAAIWVYVRHQAFGFGGAVLTVFGAILLGMPVWRTIDVSIDQKGISAKFEQLRTEIIEVQQGAEAKISQVEKRTDDQISRMRQRTEALEQYEAIQALYGEHKSKKSCSEYRRIVEQIKVYTESTNPVPESFRYTIRYPSQKAMPTISDLAIDRITRIQRVRSQCFE